MTLCSKRKLGFWKKVYERLAINNPRHFSGSPAGFRYHWYWLNQLVLSAPFWRTSSRIFCAYFAADDRHIKEALDQESGQQKFCRSPFLDLSQKHLNFKCLVRKSTYLRWIVKIWMRPFENGLFKGPEIPHVDHLCFVIIGCDKRDRLSSFCKNWWNVLQKFAGNGENPYGNNPEHKLWDKAEKRRNFISLNETTKSPVFGFFD